MGKGAPLGSSDCPVEEGRVAGLIFQPLGPAVAVLIIQPLADFFGGSGARADAVDMPRMQRAAARRWLLQDRRLPKVSL